MPLPGSSPRWATSQPRRCSGDIERSTPRRRESRASPPRTVSTGRPPTPSCSSTSWTTRALAVAVVASTGVSAGRPVEEVADAAVVGPEVVPPVADAVGLVDDEQAAAPGQVGQLLVAEARVVEPLGADEQDVDGVGGQRLAHLVPVLGVGGVHRHGADAGPLGGRDLVAHQRQQRADDDGGPGALGAAQRGRDEVDRGLAPAGALDHEHARSGPRPARRPPRAGRRGSRRPRGRPAGAAPSRALLGERAGWSAGAGASVGVVMVRPPYAARPTPGRAAVDSPPGLSREGRVSASRGRRRRRGRRARGRRASG